MKQFHSTLAGFGVKDSNYTWSEPFNSQGRFPSCSLERFQLPYEFIVGETTDDYIKNLVLDIAEKLSLAFGVTEVKCFETNNSFNFEGMIGFNR